MPKTIETLINDIYGVLAEGVDITPFVHEEPEHNKGNPYLRLSSIGQPCERKLWYEINEPDKGEPLHKHAKMMFTIGHVIEHVVLDLAKKAGHSVTDEQREVEVNGVRGHLDGVVDGVVVDVKSASPYSFARFKEGLEAGEDKFGYLTQLGSYLLSMRGSESVSEMDRAAFLVINKVTGELHLDVHTFTEADFDALSQLVEDRKEAVKKDIPDRAFTDVPDGKSGNRMLDTNCSYCSFKHECWPGLRTFMYANKPKFLTTVAREPNVPELHRQED